jgi:autotransporter-associated beta strand protein
VIAAGALPAVIISSFAANAACIPGADNTPSPSPGSVVTCSGTTTNQNGTNGYGTGNQSGITINVQNSASVTGSGSGINVLSSTIINNFGTIAGDTTGISTSVTGFAQGSSIFNAGTISGGTAAIRFVGFENTLTIAPGSVINGAVITSGSSLNTLQLGGTGSATFDVSNIGAGRQYQAFGRFEKVDSSTWTLTGAFQFTQNSVWSINGGTLSVASTASLNPNAAVRFNGGTLQITGSSLHFISGRDWGVNGGTVDVVDPNNTVNFQQHSEIFPHAAGGALIKRGAGTLVLQSTDNINGAVISGGILRAGGSLGNGSLTLDGGTLQPVGVISWGIPIKINGAGGTIDAHAAPFFQLGGDISDGTGGPGPLTLTSSGGPGVLYLSGTNTYSGATTITGVTVRSGAQSPDFDALFGIVAHNGLSPNSAYTVDANAVLDLNGFNATIGSLAGAGSVILRAKTLTAGVDNSSTSFSGALSGSGGSFTKSGTGKMDITGVNTYSGVTTVNGGALAVTGSIASSSLTTVNGNATLVGTGTVGNTTIANGGAFAPGNGTPGSSMTVAGNLAFQSGALYLVGLNPATSTFASVTGSATLNGGAGAAFLTGNYVAKQYTILTAAGGINGTFGSFNTLGVPAGFNANLTYGAHDVFLNLNLNFALPGGLNGNQQNAANALTNFFNTNGGIPLVFGGLTPVGLTQISGEVATGTQQTTFNAMGLFMGLMTDPFVAGRGDPVSAGANAPQFAEEDDAANAYASNGKPRSKTERDAYAAVYRKAPVMADPFTQRWSVWAAGYGGSQTTDGNAVLGSNNTRSSIGGVAVGADYRFSPYTLAGFALAGGATNFSVNGLGSGRSDLFQAGAFVRHNVGAAYLTGALAYGWQDITTDRTVTVAGTDLLRAQFNANAFSGRAEGGYRFLTPWLGGIGLTPYAAAQFVTFDLPAYAEQAIAGANTFALSYAGKSVTDTRSELGLRTDKSFAMQNGIFTLRGRAAWAHDFNTDRAITPTFQTLPGASFVVNGAAPAHDSALVTASAEMKWLNGFSLAGTFEGEFSNVTRSYAGKGAVRYAW